MSNHEHEAWQVRVNGSTEPYCTGCGAVLARDDPAVLAALRLEQHGIAAKALNAVYGQARAEGPHAPGFRGGKVPPPRSVHSRGSAIYDPVFRDRAEEGDAP